MEHINKSENKRCLHWLPKHQWKQNCKPAHSRFRQQTINIQKVINLVDDQKNEQD